VGFARGSRIILITVIEIKRQISMAKITGFCGRAKARIGRIAWFL